MSKPHHQNAGLSHPAKSDKLEAVSKIVVSIVEDDAHIRQILGGWLRGAKDIECASESLSGEAALVEVPGKKPDVVLMDINLPGMSGIECVRQLKPQLPKTQFMMLTVYEDSDHIFNALAAGATGYLLKQTPCDELLGAIRRIYAGESPMTGSIARLVVETFRKSSPQPTEEYNLTQRERQVLELLASGHLYKEISDLLKISVPTVNTHIRHIYEKLHVQSRGRAVAIFHKLSAGEAGGGTAHP
jgi:DNA-binding NarL/FixJ family response regulator